MPLFNWKGKADGLESWKTHDDVASKVRNFYQDVQGLGHGKRQQEDEGVEQSGSISCQAVFFKKEVKKR